MKMKIWYIIIYRMQSASLASTVVAPLPAPLGSGGPFGEGMRQITARQVADQGTDDPVHSVAVVSPWGQLEVSLCSKMGSKFCVYQDISTAASRVHLSSVRLGIPGEWPLWKARNNFFKFHGSVFLFVEFQKNTQKPLSTSVMKSLTAISLMKALLTRTSWTKKLMKFLLQSNTLLLNYTHSPEVSSFDDKDISCVLQTWMPF